MYSDNNEKVEITYCNSDILRFSIGSHLEVVYSKLNQSCQIIPTSLSHLISHCFTFKDLDQHARTFYLSTHSNPIYDKLQKYSDITQNTFVLRFLNRLLHEIETKYCDRGKEQIVVIKNYLKEFVEQGFLISNRSVISNSTITQSMTSKVSSIGVVTRDRLPALKRCLVSYIENTKEYDKKTDFIVMDDSELIGNRNNTRDMLQSLKNIYNVDIYYAGLEEKTSFARSLVEVGKLPSEVVKFCLFDINSCKQSFGANRNSLLLHTLGSIFIGVDDDTICKLATSPTYKNNLTLFSGFDPTHFWFFPDRNHVSQYNYDNKDLVTTHEQLLGKSLSDLLNSYPIDIELKNATSRFFKSSKDDGKILVTYNGIIGDSGLFSPDINLRLNGNSRIRLLSSKETYSLACHSREVLRVVNSLTVSDDWWVTATIAGFDNSNLLPPFMPIQRNEDGVFGEVLRRCFTYGYFGHLPWAVLHAPIKSRFYTDNDLFKKATGIRFCDVVFSLMSLCEFGYIGSEPSERLRQLGKHLINVGSMDLPEFEECVRLGLWKYHSALINALETNLKKNQNKPIFWAKDVEYYIKTLQKSMLKEDYVVPQDLVERKNQDLARTLSKYLISQFGQLLFWWPDIVEVTKLLIFQGKRVAIKI
jgi:hypothetical protein